MTTHEVRVVFWLCLAIGSGCSDDASGVPPSRDLALDPDLEADEGASDTGGDGVDAADEAGECVPGDRLCSSPSTFRECGAAGTFGDDQFCTVNQLCQDGDCSDVTPTQAWCEPCAGDADCVDGRCYVTDEGGWCVNPCASAAECPDDGGCMPFGDGRGAMFGSFCLPMSGDCREAPLAAVGETCASDDDCASGLCLEDRTGAPACSRFCSRPADCPSGFTCLPWPTDTDGDEAPDAWAGACVADMEAAGTLGEECIPEMAGADCRSGFCGRGLDEVTHNCSSVCERDLDCPGDLRCAEIDLELAEGAAPVDICRAPAGDSCRETNWGVEVCDGLDNDCSGEADDGGVCDVPPAIEVVEMNLGSVELFGTGQTTQLFAFELDDNAISFTVVVRDLEDSIGTLAALIDPAGSDRVGDLKPYGFDDTLAVQIPNSPEIELAAGTWQLAVVNFQQSVTADVSVLVKAGQLPARQTLPMNLFFAGTDVDAASAPSDPDFQAVLATVSDIYGDAAIDIDTSLIDYFDVADPRFTFIDTTDGADSELRQLFAESAAAAQDGRVNIFFVRTIAASTPGFITLGIAGGIPGPPGINGTRSSGVVVGLDSFGPGSLGQRTNAIAATWAHEMGHFMGLFHTSERTGDSFDPLPDTPECSGGRDANSDGFFLAAECGGFGADNLMFWEANPTSRDLSEQQSDVLRRNAVTF